ncbi:MAG: alpha/beta fold hydrolase [Dysgonomonas sp.]|nr:alpha/beta fold hydrolase [Dysgonomonas sp.]
MKKTIRNILIILIAIYFIFCGFFFFTQEKFIFHPQKLDKDYKFHFYQQFEEINIVAQDGASLNGLLFTVDQPKGLIFFLHGNAGALDSWGQLASVYTDLGYDIFFLDYRGFGKSSGKIENQNQLLDDIRLAYKEMNKRYAENRIIVLGFSIGTGIAANIASENSPRILILQAPYYSLTNVIQGFCPIIPSFLIKYKLETFIYLVECKMPVTIFHGDNDKVIDYSNSILLKDYLKENDALITLQGEGHNGINYNDEYRSKIAEILN